jgi:hypothetical protein
MHLFLTFYFNREEIEAYVSFPDVPCIIQYKYSQHITIQNTVMLSTIKTKHSGKSYIPPQVSLQSIH